MANGLCHQNAFPRCSSLPPRRLKKGVCQVPRCKSSRVSIWHGACYVEVRRVAASLSHDEVCRLLPRRGHDEVVGPPIAPGKPAQVIGRPCLGSLSSTVRPNNGWCSTANSWARGSESCKTSGRIC